MSTRYIRDNLFRPKLFKSYEYFVANNLRNMTGSPERNCNIFENNDGNSLNMTKDTNRPKHMYINDGAMTSSLYP